MGPEHLAGGWSWLSVIVRGGFCSLNPWAGQGVEAFSTAGGIETISVNSLGSCATLSVEGGSAENL